MSDMDLMTSGQRVALEHAARELHAKFKGGGAS